MIISFISTYDVIRTPKNGSAVNGHMMQTEPRDQYTALSLEGVLLHIYDFSYNFDTVSYKFLEIGTSDITFMGLDQELK